MLPEHCAPGIPVNTVHASTQLGLGSGLSLPAKHSITLILEQQRVTRRCSSCTTFMDTHIARSQRFLAVGLEIPNHICTRRGTDCVRSFALETLASE
jgi:hypothetical protein